MDHVRGGAGMILAALIAVSGCVTPAQEARRCAQRMADPRRSPREALEAQRRLLGLGAAGEPYLDDAFFPLGLYDAPAGALPTLSETGFNLVVSADKDDAAYVARCESLGVRLVPYVNLERMGADVARVRDVRTVWAWYLFDEPDLNQREPEFIRRHFEVLRRADPTRPIYLTVWSPKRYADFISFCDVFAANPYPIVKRDAGENQLRAVAWSLDRARRLAAGRDVWAVIQAFWAEPWWPRNPTPQELRAMVYLALNHGARGVVFFSYKSGDRPVTEHADLFAEIARLNMEVRLFKPMVLTGVAPRAVSVELIEETGRPPAKDAAAWPPADAALRWFEGQACMTIVNPDPWPKRVRVRLAGGMPATGRAVDALAGEGGRHAVTAGEWAMDLTPFQVGILAIEAERNAR